MTNINISIRKEAYEFLKTLKDRNKSFSDVILEMKSKEKQNGSDTKSILRFAGALKDEDIDWDEKEKRMKEFRESFNKRLASARKLHDRV